MGADLVPAAVDRRVAFSVIVVQCSACGVFKPPRDFPVFGPICDACTDAAGEC